MRKALLVFGTTLLYLCLSSTAFCFDIPLKFEKAPTDQSVFFPYGYGYMDVTTIKPAGDWKLPSFNSEKPLYVLLKFGDSNHLLVIDTPMKDDKNYSSIIFDSDGNGDLTDNPPIQGKLVIPQGAPPGGYYTIEFAPIDFFIKDNTKKIKYSIMPILYGEKVGNSTSLSRVNFQFQVTCVYTATFKIGGSQYTLKLNDRNANGKFTDEFKTTIDRKNYPGHNPIYTQGDLVYISDGNKIDYYDGLPFGNLLYIKDKLFNVKIDVAGGKMTLKELKKDLYPLKMSINPERFSVYTDTTKCIMGYKPSGNLINLPVGSYNLHCYELFRKDMQGDLWRIITVETIDSPAVTVSSGKEAVLSFGEPFIPVIFFPQGANIQAYGRNIPLAFALEGNNNEVVTNLNRIEGKSTKIPLSTKTGRENRPKEPSYTIIKSDGEVTGKGSFEYG
jgi:hypothetical protein